MDDSTTNIIIYILLSTVIGFAMLIFLKNIVNSSNAHFVEKYAENNKLLNAEISKMFEEMIKNFQAAHQKNISEIKLFTDFLKKETDKYSETTSVFRNTISTINKDLKDLSQTNKDLTKSLHEITFKEIKNYSVTLKEMCSVFRTNQEVFEKNTESVAYLLKGFYNSEKIIEQADKNLSMILKLNSNHEELIKKFKETMVQIALVNETISNVSEGKLKPIFEEVRKIIPDIRTEASNVSSDLYGKFSESIEKLGKLSDNLNDITNKYNLLLEGNRRDPVTGEFLT